MKPTVSMLCCQVNPAARCTYCNVPLCKDHMEERRAKKVKLGTGNWESVLPGNTPCTTRVRDAVFDGHFF